jgi:hypothetical protein
MSLEDLKQDVRELSRQVSRIAEDTARNTVILAEHIRRTELLEKASMSIHRFSFFALLLGIGSLIPINTSDP